MTPPVPPPLTPPYETEIIRYRVKYDLDANKATVEIFYHEMEKRIDKGKMSKIEAVKSKKIEGDPRDLALLVDILRNENPVLVIDYKNDAYSLKTSGEESAKQK